MVPTFEFVANFAPEVKGAITFGVYRFGRVKYAEVVAPVKRAVLYMHLGDAAPVESDGVLALTGGFPTVFVK